MKQRGQREKGLPCPLFLFRLDGCTPLNKRVLIAVCDGAGCPLSNIQLSYHVVPWPIIRPIHLILATNAAPVILFSSFFYVFLGSLSIFLGSLSAPLSLHHSASLRIAFPTSIHSLIHCSSYPHSIVDPYPPIYPSSRHSFFLPSLSYPTWLSLYTTGPSSATHFSSYPRLLSLSLTLSLTHTSLVNFPFFFHQFCAHFASPSSGSHQSFLTYLRSES